MKLQCILCWWCLGLMLQVSMASAQQETHPEADGNPAHGESPAPAKSLSSYKGEGSMYLGFRLVDLDDSGRAAEYEEDKSSITLGIEAIACPLPHRYHIHSEYFSEHNYYGDIGYAYRDFLLLRNIIVGVHRNLDHYDYLYPGDPPAVLYDDRNVGDENYVDYTKNDLLLRIKAPDYPFHTFLKHRYVERDGSLDERFLLGRIGNRIKTSQSRNIDWQAEDLSLGVNSHLGPVEIEYVYNSGEFDPGDNNILYDTYPTSVVFGRPGDTYPHNVIPETESYANSLKFHSSYTGQIVISATLSNAENKNNYSGVESEAWKAAFDLRWIPDPVISLFFKYRHHDQDKENPDQVVLSGQVQRITYPVRPLISTKKDQVSLSARYRPLNKLTLIGNYDFEHRQRSDVDEWEVLPVNSDIHRISLTAQARPMDKLSLKAIYNFQNHNNPSYNTDPDYFNKLRLSTTYSPATWLTALLDYSLTLSQRDDLRYLNIDPDEVLVGGERDGRTDHLLGSLSFVLSTKASLTASWTYYRWKIEQDLTYSLWSTSGSGRDYPYYDHGVPYTDESNTFTLSLYYQVRKDLALTADCSYTIAEGDYVPGGVIQGDPSSLASFSSMETTETAFSVELAKKILQDWEIGLKFQANIYDDKFSDDGGAHQDGELYVTTLTLKRYF